MNKVEEQKTTSYQVKILLRDSELLDSELVNYILQHFWKETWQHLKHLKYSSTRHSFLGVKAAIHKDRYTRIFIAACA